MLSQWSNSLDIYNINQNSGILEYVDTQDMSGASGQFNMARNIFFDGNNRAYVCHVQYGLTLYDVDPISGKLTAQKDYDAGYSPWGIIVVHLDE